MEKFSKVRRVIISDVKNIKKLEFEIPNTGVYVLTGPNGSGKTTLLASLYRIGYRNAYAEYFKTTANNQRLDYFGNASVTYQIGSEEVSYNYGNTRWSPTPKKNIKLLSQMGFPDVRFIAANAKRIEPTSDELKTNRIKPANTVVISQVKSILSDKKFDDLKVINTKRGIGNQAFLIQKKIGSKNYYFSEKNFSLGELCVLKLVSEIQGISDRSLILIDEIEMALHPKAQALLLDYLVRMSKEKELTIIFSTHSSSLIKRAGRKQILLLQNDGEGNISCIPRCFPAQALGDIAFDEEVQPDFLFFVEDYKAKFLLEEMLDSYKKAIDNQAHTPFYKVVPVGGFTQVIEFLINSDQIFSDSVKRFAFLDEDVKIESLKLLHATNNYVFLKKFNDNNEKIKYLPCTPEQGFIDLIESNVHQHSKQLKTKLRGENFDLERIMVTEEYRNINSSKPRELAKKKMECIVSEIHRKTGKTEESINHIFSSYFVDEHYKSRESELKRLFGPIFNFV